MKEKMENKYFKWGLTLFLVLAVIIIFYFFLLRWKDIFFKIFQFLKIFSPFLYGFIIAYLLSPIIKWLEKQFFKKLSKKIIKDDEKKADKLCRTFSILVSTIILLGIIICFMNFVIPELFKSLNLIISNIPQYMNNGKEWLLGLLTDKPDLEDLIINNYDNIAEGINNYFGNGTGLNFNNILTNITSGIASFVGVLYNLVLGYIIALYLLVGKEKFIAQGKKLMYTIIKPDKALIILDNLKYSDKIFGGFLLGKIIDSLIIGALCFVFMLIFRMPYAVLIAVIIGITNIIPYFGPFIGAVPCALLVLLVSPSKCLTFIIFIIILQQFDGNVLGPKILGDKTGLQSFWVLFSIIVFGGLFGFMGMLIGVPLFAIIYSFVNGLCSRKLHKNKLPLTTTDYLKIDYIDPKDNKPVYYK